MVFFLSKHFTDQYLMEQNFTIVYSCELQKKNKTVKDKKAIKVFVGLSLRQIFIIIKMLLLNSNIIFSHIYHLKLYQAYWNQEVSNRLYHFIGNAAFFNNRLAHAVRLVIKYLYNDCYHYDNLLFFSTRILDRIPRCFALVLYIVFFFHGDQI